MRPVIEVCVEGVDGAIAAAAGGADRAELCASLVEGGITPSLGTVRATMRRTAIALHVMVRPRGGDFLYSEAEFASMLDDVALFRDEGVAGVVVGCLQADGTVDVERTRALVQAARPASVAFHRAFDMTRDPHAALEALIACGVDRVLTSGQRPNAIDGLALLRALVAQAAGRIVVLGCGALAPETIGQVRRDAGLAELHFSAGVEQPSAMAFRNPALFMGAAPPEREYLQIVTDPARVSRMIAAATGRMSGAAPLRWGFLGASRIGRRALAPAVLESGHTLHAVAARDVERARDFAQAFGGARAYGGYDALIDDPAIDAIYIALTNDAHVHWTIRALHAGKHVLCEKPLAMNAAEVARMLEAEQASGRMVLEAFAYRFNAQMGRLAEVLRAGEVGRVIAAHVSFGAPMPDDDFRWTGALGGGALYDIGCYCLDLLRLVLAAEPVHVVATAKWRGDVDAGTAGLLTCSDGAVGQFSCSFEAARGQHLAVMGEAGALSLDWPFAHREPEARLVVNGTAEMFGPSRPYHAMVAHFADAIAGRVRLRHPLSQSLSQARAMDALFDAARRSCAVTL